MMQTFSHRRASSCLYALDVSRSRSRPDRSRLFPDSRCSNFWRWLERVISVKVVIQPLRATVWVIAAFPVNVSLALAQQKFAGPNVPNNEMRPMDCSKAPNPEYCALHNQAQLACQEKAGRDYRRCLNEQLPGPPPLDCSRQPAEARAACARQTQARASCQGKTGDAHLVCMKGALESQTR